MEVVGMAIVVGDGNWECDGLVYPGFHRSHHGQILVELVPGRGFK